MLRRVDAQQGREIVGQKGSRDCAGVLYPYYWPGDASPFNYRLRRDHPDVKQGKNGELKPDRKYLGAPGSANRLYIPPGVTLEQLADVTIPIAICEGEKKALALSRLALHESPKPRFIPIAIAGVWSWRGNVGKTTGPKGDRIDIKGPIPDLDRIAWKNRKVFVIFDVNVQTNESVNWARKGIAREIATRSAAVFFVNLPEDCGVNGIDDLLAAWGPTKVLELFERSASGSRLHVVLPPQFQSKPEGMFRVTGKDGQLSQLQLTNYQAAITANIQLDDGIETRREFEIDTQLLGRSHRFTIPADEFTAMDWPIKFLGAAAITFPNQKEYARTAVQSLSMTAEERRIYTHSGWREVAGRQLFLHAGGAIDGTGPVSDINVRLGGSMAGYQLLVPTEKDALITAVRASLRLLDLGPASISFPLLAATCRAVFGDADFAIHLAGETGTFKSELAALHQQHFGASMDRLHLPGTWSSTGNALEAMAFHAKDTLFVIDDFAPQGSASDVARYHAAADRVFRAAGNHAGRGRLDSTAKLRESKPPRALILSTGEDIPRGHSIRARLFILELAKGAIAPDALTECQRDGRSGLYAEAMGAFVRRVAECYAGVRTAFETRLVEYRAATVRSSAHARTPEIVANLLAGFDLYLDFCVDCEALERSNRQSLADRCWAALQEAANVQAKHQTATEPTARYLAVIKAALASGRAHLEARDGGAPGGLERSCGWRQSGGGGWSPQGDCIGWLDHHDIYLEAGAAYRLVQVAVRDAGEVLAVSEQTLSKRLHERQLLASVDLRRQTLTVRRTILGSSKSVLHLFREKLLPEAPDDADPPDQAEK
jgi:hypothetical protein